MHILQLRLPSKLAFLFSLDITFTVGLRNSKRIPQSRFSGGGAVEAAIDGVNGTIDSVMNTALVLVVGSFSETEMAKEKRHIDKSFVYLRGKDFRGLNQNFVSPHRVSRHTRRRC